MNSKFGALVVAGALAPMVALATDPTPEKEIEAKDAAKKTTSDVAPSTPTKEPAKVVTPAPTSSGGLRGQAKDLGHQGVQKGADAATKKWGHTMLGKGIPGAQGAANTGVDKGVDYAADKANIEKK